MTASGALSGITCSSVVECWAVGVSYESFPPQPLIGRWDGTSWSAVPAPGVGLGLYHTLPSVSCTTASDCWAVGSYYGDSQGIFFSHWNGKAWTVSNSMPGVFQLNGVRCSSRPTAPWSVGHGPEGRTFVERWDGVAWNPTAAASGLAPTGNGISDISCVSPNDCWAVGSYDPGIRALTQHWDGNTWTIVASPIPVAFGSGRLSSVSCTSASDCWAVGSYNSPSASGVLIEHWDGSAWSIVTVADNPPSGRLRDVTCNSATDCWAVGTFSDGIGRALIEHWDGSAWTRVPSPEPSAFGYELSGVSCTSASDCWAVGSAEISGGGARTLIQRWNGVSWAIVNSPNASQQTGLRGVTCASPTDCWAVGYFDQAGLARALIEHWDGSSWAIVPTNTAATAGGYLSRVECSSPSDCWAVGEISSQGSIEHWDGASWSVVRVGMGTSFLSEQGILNGIACPLATNCWAVGFYSPAFSIGLVQTRIGTLSPTIPPLQRVASEMNHGSAGVHAIDLPLSGVAGIECRADSALGAGIDTIVFEFHNELMSVGNVNVSSGTGSVSAAVLAANPHKLVVSLTGVTNQQRIALSLSDVRDTAGNIGANLVASIDLLLGDVNADGTVNLVDVGQTKAQSGGAIGSSNFRADLNASGQINGGDVGFVKSWFGTALPGCNSG